MIFYTTLTQFSSNDNFRKLQNKFLMMDDSYMGDIIDLQEIKKEDFSIIYKDYKKDGSELYLKKYFYKDLIEPSIPFLAKNEIRKISAQINEDFIYKENERKNYINHKISQYNEIDLFINLCTFLEDDIKIDVSSQIQTVLNYLHDDNILKNQFEENNKMKLKLNKNDIHMLFILLRQANIVEHPYDADLGRHIDNFFLYYDKDEDTFKEIKKSNKDISDFKNGNKTYSRSLERLKELFYNEEFYIYKG